MVLREHRFNAIEQTLSFPYVCYLWDFLDALNALLFQILRQLATHSPFVAVSQLRAHLRRYQAHLLGLLDQILVLRFQTFILPCHSLG